MNVSYVGDKALFNSVALSERQPGMVVCLRALRGASLQQPTRGRGRKRRGGEKSGGGEARREERRGGEEGWRGGEERRR